MLFLADIQSNMHIKKIYIALILLASIAIGILGSGYCEAITPKQAYFNAEACYKKLRNAPAKMKFRHNWLGCIEKFQTVYRLDSTGPWAPAGLYMSGKMYKELAKRSGKSSDLQEAHDIFERIIKRFPESKYKAKAAAQIRTLPKSAFANKKTVPSKTTPKPKQSADDRYLAAESCYSNLKQSSHKMGLRHNWLKCIENYYSVYRRDPAGDRAAPSLFMTGKTIWRSLSTLQTQIRPARRPYHVQQGHCQLSRQSLQGEGIFAHRRHAPMGEKRYRYQKRGYFRNNRG